MTPSEIIDIVDRITPNAHTSADKLRWLQELDAQIRAEKALLYAVLRPEDAVDDRDGRLEIPAPFGSDVYVSYLQACMAWADEEDARYDRFITRFNDAYRRYMGYELQIARAVAASCLKF